MGQKIVKRKLKVFNLCIILFVIMCFSVGIYTFISFLPVDKNKTDSIDFIIESGWGKHKIVDELKDKDLIRNPLIFKIYLKIKKVNNIYAGTYRLNKGMNIVEIVKTISSTDSLENENIVITFVEGKRFPYYVSLISEKFGFKEEDIYSFINDEYLNKLIDKYWFIDDSVLNKELYYPLEGYIFPDTYSFKKKSSIDEVIETMLNQMGKKLEPFKNEITNKNMKIHSLLTLASVVELEAVNETDRALVAGVFTNRINSSVPLGSDVTTYYGLKKELMEKLSDRDCNTCNAYNTRGNCIVGLPVGPIACPSMMSIKAALNPTVTDYNFFVADKNGKMYFSKNNTEHQAIIRELNSKGLWE